MAQTEPIRDPKQVQSLLAYYKGRNETRNQVLVTITLHTALRISDILKLNCNDVYNFATRKVRKKIMLTESKTGKNKIVALHSNIRKALNSYLPQARPNVPLILNSNTGKSISRVHAYRIIATAANAVGITQNVSPHSLRKTFGYHAWKDGISPAVIMEIYNHSSLAVTRRYLGVAQSDMNKVYTTLNFAC
jgi:site-specific recombinase XerD